MQELPFMGMCMSLSNYRLVVNRVLYSANCTLTSFNKNGEHVFTDQFHHIDNQMLSWLKGFISIQNVQGTCLTLKETKVKLVQSQSVTIG